MNRILILIVVITLALAHMTGVNAYASSFTNIKARCKDKWGHNYTMIEHCYSTQLNDARGAFKYFKEHLSEYQGRQLTQADIDSDPEAVIVLDCFSKWKVDEFDTYNFTMIKYCCKSQLDAYERME